MELPTSHRIPVSWIKTHACAAIRWRTVQELLPPGSATDKDLKSLRQESLNYRPVTQIIKKQRDNGIWAGNLLGVVAKKSEGIRDVGTIARYRQLIELGVHPGARPIRLSNRMFFRVLSRDPDVKLGFEFEKDSKKNPAVAAWSRDLLREGATAALAQARMESDPRVRGSAKRVVNTVSTFLRSDLADSPYTKAGAKTILHPGARPPTLFTVAIVAHMPSLRRERSGFVERMCQYVTTHRTSKTYTIQVGGKSYKPTFQLLGDPLELDSSGKPADIPFALHWIELLSRLGMLESSPTAQRALAKLLKDCDDLGVWNPRNLRTLPKSKSNLADFAFPLEMDGKTAERRKSDVTFRLALIAKLNGWELEFT